MASIPTNRPQLPTVESLQNGAPAHGSCVSSLVDAINGSMGFDTLRVIANYCQIGAWQTVDTAALASTLPILTRFTPSPMARYLFVAVVYTSDLQRNTAPSSLTLSVETAAGVVVDSGFSVSRGRYLAGAPEQDVENALNALGRYTSQGAIAGLERVFSTGWSVSPLGGARLLDLGANAGSDLVLKVEPNVIRVYSIIAIEAYRSEVT